MRYSINISQKLNSPYKFILFALIFITLLLFQAGGESQNFPKQRLLKDHFVIYHENRNVANKLGWKAEYYYKRILRHLGVQGFHPWEGENKCVILIFKTHDEYVKEMNAPEWSAGIALRDKSLFAMFEGAKDIEVGTLPHELTHLILNEYFGNPDLIPRWFTEGMAQYEEEERADYNYKKFILENVKEDKRIKLADLFDGKYILDTRLKISLFYAQSASIIDYMRTRLLQTQFSQFLEEIKNGKSVDEALKEVYQWKFPNGISDFEKRWLEYVTTSY